jgi:hypothetical protein
MRAFDFFPVKRGASNRNVGGSISVSPVNCFAVFNGLAGMATGPPAN